MIKKDWTSGTGTGTSTDMGKGKGMKFFFLKLFNIYHGEERRAALFSLLGFLWAFAVTAGLKFADALFLLHVGAAELPTAYKFTACIMIFLAILLLYAFHEFSIEKIFIFVLSVGIVFYLIVSAALNYSQNETQFLWFALRIFGTLFFAVAITCYWTFVDHFHHLQDAKRLYGLFSSTVFIGIACTGVLMRSGLFSFQQVTFGIVALLILSIALIRYIINTINFVHDEHHSMGTTASQESQWSSQLKAMLSSGFTLLLMTSNFLIYVLLVITEYNYMSSFDAAFDPQGTIAVAGNEQNAKLTQFLGQWLAVISISNIIFGLFLYGRLARRFGISSLLFYTPVILLGTFSGWTVSASLLFPIIGMFVVEGTLYVIDDSNFNLLLNAVPIKLKYKIRLIIESFFEPIGMLVSSFLLSVAWIDSKILGLVLSALLLIVALAMQRQYIKGIYRNLAENAIHFHRRFVDWLTLMRDKDAQAARKRLLAIIRQEEEQLLPMAIEGITSIGEPALVSKMMKQVDHLSKKSKMVCIDVLTKLAPLYQDIVVPHFNAWLNDEENQLLQGSIHFYLASIGQLDSHKIVEDLNSHNLLLKGAAILALKSSKDFANAQSLAESQLLNMFESQDEDTLCMALKIAAIDPNRSKIHALLPFLKHPSPRVANAAAYAVLQFVGPQDSSLKAFFLNLLTESSDSELRIHCLAILSKINDPSLAKEVIAASIHFRPVERRYTERIIANMGTQNIPVLLAMVKDSQLHDRCRVLASRILGRLDLPLLREQVYDIIKIEIERAFFYFYYYHNVQSMHPQLDLHILEDALLTGYHSVVDFIIQLLGVAGELEDCELLSRSLRSPHPKIRSQVLETLERTSETKIFRLLSPLVSDLPDHEKLQYYRRTGNTKLTLFQLLDKLEESSAFVDKIVAAALKYRFNIPDWKSSLMKQLSTNEELFQHFAHELLET